MRSTSASPCWRWSLLEQVFQLGLLPGAGRRLALGVEPAGQHPQPFDAGQGADHHGIFRGHAGADAVLGREAGDQRRGFLRAALGVQVVIERQVPIIGWLAQVVVAADGAIAMAPRAEHLAHEQALADLRGPVGRRRHRHLGRSIEAAGQPAELQDLELVALGHRRQVRLAPRRIELRQPIAQIGRQALDLFRPANQVPIALVWKCHEEPPASFP